MQTVGQRTLGDWLRERVLAWLGLGDVVLLLRGIRADMGPLESAARMNAQTTRLLADRVKDVSATAGSANARLTHYEHHVPTLQREAMRLREKWEREARRAEAAAKLAAGPADAAVDARADRPEMSEEVAGA